MSEEKREFHRISVTCKMSISYNDSHERSNSHSENISAGGLMFIMESKVIPRVSGETALDLFLWDDANPVRLRARLAWINEITPIEVNPRLFNVGLQFIEVNDADKDRLKGFVNSLISSWK